MSEFVELVYRWINTLTYGDNTAATELRQEIALSHDREIAYLTFRAAQVLMKH